MIIIYKGIEVIVEDTRLTIKDILFTDITPTITLEALNAKVIKLVEGVINPNQTNLCPKCNSTNNAIVLHHPEHNNNPAAKILRCYDCKLDFIIN